MESTIVRISSHESISYKAYSENKDLSIWDQSALFGYFWAGIFENFCHIWNQHPRICQTWVSTNTLNFDTRCVFSKDLDRGPGPLHKVCLYHWLWMNFTYCFWKYTVNFKHLFYLPEKQNQLTENVGKSLNKSFKNGSRSYWSEAATKRCS